MLSMILLNYAKKLPRSARNLPRTSWSTIASTHCPHIHPPCHPNEIPDRQDPKWGGGGDWPLATFNNSICAKDKQRFGRYTTHLRFLQGLIPIEETNGISYCTCEITVPNATKDVLLKPFNKSHCKKSVHVSNADRKRPTATEHPSVAKHLHFTRHLSTTENINISVTYTSA